MDQRRMSAGKELTRHAASRPPAENDFEIEIVKEEYMPKYGKKASKKVEKAMHERKKGTLKSGRSGKKVTSKKQAIAIGLSEAREAGAKVPPKKSAAKKK